MKRPILTKGISSPLILVSAILTLSLTLFNALAGCSSGVSVARVFSDFNISFGRSYETSKGFHRFMIVYDKYAAKTRTRSQQIKHFSDAFNRVRNEYVQPTDDDILLSAAIEGIRKLKGRPGTIAPRLVTEAALDSLVTTLDPHSSYLNPEEYKESQISTSGKFGGLGIEINMDRERSVIRIISPIADTPASKAGLIPGDLITHVDGDPIKGMDLRYAVKRLRGRPNTQVRLRIQRKDTVFDVVITRAIIHIQPVKWKVEGDIGIIRITHFITRSDVALQTALDKMFKNSNYQINGLVLDLRNNPGGLLNQSVSVADTFLESGEIVSVRSRMGNQREFSADGQDLIDGLPIVVLINRGSASASEIVAGALQDHGRAVVMGTRSFGKGSVQTITPLNWNGALRLTTALYYLPSGRTIQGRGVAPDIELSNRSEGPERKIEGDLPNAIKVDVPSTNHGTRYNYFEDSCPGAGEQKKDRILGCAIMFINAGSEADFVYLMNQRRNSGVER